MGSNPTWKDVARSYLEAVGPEPDIHDVMDGLSLLIALYGTNTLKKVSKEYLESDS